MLEDGDGRFFLLLAATVKPRRVHLPPAAARGDVTAGITEEVELLMDRKDPLWVSNVGKTRHYLYPIHISRAFFSTPSLASALYMLMMRMYNAQYAEACRLITSCVSDTELTPEEQQIWDQLADLRDDMHPDACATRLRLWLITNGSRTMTCPWTITTQLEVYVRQRHLVSATCRFSLRDELMLLRQAGAEEERLATEAVELAAKVRGGYLARRRAKAAALVRAEVKAPSMALTNREQQLRYALEVGGGNMIFMFPPEYKGEDRSVQYRVAAAPAWDEVKDESALTPELKKSMLSKLTTGVTNLAAITYERPDEAILGNDAVLKINEIMASGLRLSGGNFSLGFLFLYELMTGTMDMRVLTQDDPSVLARFLLRTIPRKDSHAPSVMMSILRIIACNDRRKNPELVNALPKYVDARNLKLSLFTKNHIKTLLAEVRKGARCSC